MSESLDIFGSRENSPWATSSCMYSKGQEQARASPSWPIRSRWRPSSDSLRQGSSTRSRDVNDVGSFGSCGILELDLLHLVVCRSELDQVADPGYEISILDC